MKISIITTVLNRAELIAEAVGSARGQNVDCEHIVVDGGSSDGTLNRLANFPEVRVISLPGSSPEQALNEGLRQATGDVVTFLMSDDRLSRGILAKVVATFEAKPELDVVSSGAAFFSVVGGKEVVLSRLLHRSIIDLDYRSILLGPLIACARFYRRRVFDRVGTFGTRYRYCNDRDFLWRVLAAGCRNACLEEIGYWYRVHSESRTLGAGGNAKLHIAEDHLRMAEDHLGEADLAPIHRNWFRIFHAVETARASARALMAGRIGLMAKVVRRGFAVSFVWPLVALREIAMLQVCRFPGRG